MEDDLKGQIFSFTKQYHNRPYDFISPLRPELSCAGKNALITGGSTGIGLAVSTAFAQAGAKSVTIIGRTESKLQEAVSAIYTAGVSQDVNVRYEVADLCDAGKASDAIKATADAVGKLDILVANAAGPVQIGPLLRFDAETLVKTVADNLTSTYAASRAFLSVSTAAPTIINTSSCMAHWTPTVNGGLYSIQKAAALKTMDFVAAEHPHVHVVNVQPGWVATPLNGHDKNATDTADLPGNFYVWLASAEAKFLRGKFVWANWDAEELLSRADEISKSRLLETLLDGAPV